MKPNKSRQTVDGKHTSQDHDRIAEFYLDESTSRVASNDQLISHGEDQIQDPNLGTADFSTISADLYERSWESRVKLQKLDTWIAIGLYIALCSVAFVIL